MILRLLDLNSSLEGGLVYPPKEVLHMCAWVNACVTIVLEVLHLLGDLLMACNIGLEVVLLVFNLVPEGP